MNVVLFVEGDKKLSRAMLVLNIGCITIPYELIGQTCIVVDGFLPKT